MEFAAHPYVVATEREWHVDPQPAGLRRVWDRDGLQWRERYSGNPFAYWVAVRADGTIEPASLEPSWRGLLAQFGPVTDAEPPGV